MIYLCTQIPLTEQHAQIHLRITRFQVAIVDCSSQRAGPAWNLHQWRLYCRARQQTDARPRAAAMQPAPAAGDTAKGGNPRVMWLLGHKVAGCSNARAACAKGCSDCLQDVFGGVRVKLFPFICPFLWSEPNVVHVGPLKPKPPDPEL